MRLGQPIPGLPQGAQRQARTPTGGKVRLIEGLVDDFVETVLGGSVAPLVAYLTSKVEVNGDQAAEIRRLLDRLEGDSDAA